MAQDSKGNDSSGPRHEHQESKSERSENKAVNKGRGEASEGMHDHSKKVVADVLEKRATRKSGVTGKFAEDGKPGLASADSLLPLEAASKAVGRTFSAVYKAGSNAVSETGKFLKGMGDGEVEYVKELGDSLNTAGEYYGRALSGKVNLAADIKDFSGAIGQTLGAAGDYYFKQIPKGQANLEKDISEATKAAGEHYNLLDTEHKGKFFGKEVVPILVPGAVGMVAKEVQAANLTGKVGQAITAFTGSEKIAEMEQRFAAIQSKLQQMKELATPLKPAYAAATEGTGQKHIQVETSKLNDAVLMKHGDKGLPLGIKPSEKVSISRKGFNAEGDQIYAVDVPEKVFQAAELQGIDRKIVQEKLEKLADAVHKAHLKIGDYAPKLHGTERTYGNKFHELLREKLNKLSDSQINTEASYLKGNTSSWSKLGTSRVDVSLGNKNEPFASVCLKTLKAVPSAQQERGWVRNLPKLKDGSVPPRLHLKLPEGER